MKVKKLTLLATVLVVVVLGIGSAALAQTSDTDTYDSQTDNSQPAESQPSEASESTPPPAAPPAAPAEPTFALDADGQSLLITEGDSQRSVPCQNLFREEQELLATNDYPTSASDAARACEGFGVTNPYPEPFFYDTEGYFYTYDPVEGLYYSPDPDNGVEYVYDPNSDTFNTFDPSSGAYLD